MVEYRILIKLFVSNRLLMCCVR